uniref:Uncharacterized protein n=1 Tax=Globodera rostochiensis TaxID=31243 RepID=A0A914I1T0_GLORO
MDNKSVATNKASVATNKASVANNKASVANNNESVAINKSPTTTGCGSGSNEIGAINKYGPNNNKSGRTCCGDVSIETGTKVVAIVSCVFYMGLALFALYYNSIVYVIAYTLIACVCLLIIFGLKECNPWLFLPYLILGAIHLIDRLFFCFSLLKCATQKERARKLPAWYGVEANYSESAHNSCLSLLIGLVMGIAFFVWTYSIIFRGFLAVKELVAQHWSLHATRLQAQCLARSPPGLPRHTGTARVQRRVWQMPGRLLGSIDVTNGVMKQSMPTLTTKI